jgi:hypothetical protein
MCIRRLPKITTLLGLLAATLVSLAACQGMQIETGPLVEDQGHSNANNF